jgi:hypothetical protein
MFRSRSPVSAWMKKMSTTASLGSARVTMLCGKSLESTTSPPLLVGRIRSCWSALPHVASIQQAPASTGAILAATSVGNDWKWCWLTPRCDGPIPCEVGKNRPFCRVLSLVHLRQIKKVKTHLHFKCMHLVSVCGCLPTSKGTIIIVGYSENAQGEILLRR